MPVTDISEKGMVQDVTEERNLNLWKKSYKD